MDSELRTTLEIQWVRIRGIIKTFIRVFGVALLLVGMYNLFAPAVGITRLAAIPVVGIIHVSKLSAIALGDVLVMVSGAILVHFV